MRRKVTSLLLLVGATAGTSGWFLLRDGVEQAAVASPAMAAVPVEARQTSPAVPPAELRLAVVDPESVPADPFRPAPTSTAPAPVAGTDPVSTPHEPASFIRLNPARPAAAPAASTAAVATPRGPAAAAKAAPAAPPVARTAPTVVPAAGPAPNAPAQAAPSNDDIHLKGIIRGTPDVALVCCEGQTYFAKAGERVAGTWEVREIKDNSAVLRNEGRVLELQIEGGS